MREIKFRAWDKNNGYMFYSHTNRGLEYLEFSNDGTTVIGEGDGDLRHENIPLMQYTGLKDKNGKEIYEGDVVVIPDTYTETVDVGVGSIPVAQQIENHLARVAFTEGTFVFVITDNADVLSKGKYTWGQLGEEVGIEKIEIIGNIYENPELLTHNE